MRLTVLLLTTALMHCFASGKGQDITLTARGMSFEAVLTSIKKQTGFEVAIDAQMMKAQSTITLSVQGMPLDDFLDMLVKNRPVTYFKQGKTIFFIKKEEAAPKAVVGIGVSAPPVGIRITDSAGAVLPGASVVVQNSRLSGVSDAEGMLILNVSEGDVLKVTFIGMETKSISVTKAMVDNASISVVLKPLPSRLHEVEVTVNTGYQSLPKERATGSFEFINRETLNQRVSTSIWGRLEGLSGVLFNEAYNNNIRPNYTVRGISSIDGIKDPLIVVDNFPYEGEIKNINPNDIESITILKDAAASSIWGSRAGNGVIVITTRKSAINSRFNMELASNVTIAEKPDAFYQERINSKDIIEIERMLFEKEYRFALFNNNARPFITPVYELLMQQRMNQIGSDEVERELARLGNIDIRDQYQEYFLQPSVRQQHHINLSGGNDKAAYLLSMGVNNDVSNLDERYKRHTIRIDNTFKPFERLQVRTSINYSKSDNRSGQAAMSGYAMYAELVDENGQEIPQYKLRKGFIDTLGQGLLLDWRQYPLSDYKHDYFNNGMENIRSQVQVDYNVGGGFKAQLQYQYEQQRQEMVSTRDMASYFVRDLINRFSAINYQTGAVTRPVPLGGIIDRTYRNRNAHNVRGQLNYSFQKNDHELNALAGMEVRDIKGINSAYRIYGYDSEVKTIGRVDVVNTYRSIINGANAYIPNFQSEGGTLNRFISFFGNAAYTFRKKYGVSASVRRDASNLFGVETNDKWQPMWSAGASWNLSDEDFYGSGVLPYLRLRATYGYSGNADPRKSGMTTLRYTVLAQHTNFQGAAFGQQANPQLRWETIKTANIGADFRFRNNALSGSVEYYVKEGTNLFGNSIIDYTAGLGNRYVTRNTANTITHGIDLVLNAQVIKAGSFEWQTNLLVNFNKGKITSYQVQRNNISGFISSTPKEEGKPIYAVYSYRSAGLNDAGQAQGYYEGKPSNNYSAIINGFDMDALQYHGAGMPQWFGGWTNTFRWKAWSLTANMSYKAGYYFIRPSFTSTSVLNQFGHGDYYRRWQKPGDELHTTVPAFQYPNDQQADNFYTSSSDLVEKGDHIRIQHINLAHHLSRNVHPRLPFREIKCFANLTNLGIIYRANHHGIDPDLLGADMPVPRAIALGFQVNL